MGGEVCDQDIVIGRGSLDAEGNVKEVTERHEEIYGVIKEMIRRSGGVSPTLSEIARVTRVSRQRVHEVLQILRAHGRITWTVGCPRTIRVIEEGEDEQ